MALLLQQAFKAIADPTRRDILRLLRSAEMTAGALAAQFDMSKPSMSHHFAVLKEADLIFSRRDGQTIWYALNTSVVEDVLAWALDLARGDLPAAQPAALPAAPPAAPPAPVPASPPPAAPAPLLPVAPTNALPDQESP